MIDLAILGVLSEEELHGYELTKRLADVLRPGSAVSFGSVYPALSRLERRGMVKAVEAARQRAPAIPMTGSLAGELAAARSRLDPAPRGRRARKVYGVTAAGEEHLVELLLEPAATATSAAFDLRVALFHHLDREQRLDLVNRRIATLVSRREQVQQRDTPCGRYQLARQVRELTVIEHDLAWLADLARSETATDPDAPVHSAPPPRAQPQITTADAAETTMEGNHD